MQILTRADLKLIKFIPGKNYDIDKLCISPD